MAGHGHIQGRRAANQARNVKRKRGAQNVHFPHVQKQRAGRQVHQIDQNGEFQAHAGIANAAQHRGGTVVHRKREKRERVPRQVLNCLFLHAGRGVSK